MHDVRFPGETEGYRAQRDALLAEERALRAQIEKVAGLRRALPDGGVAEDYVFGTADGERRLSELFGHHDTLLLYSFMFTGGGSAPCPMCSAFLDSVTGQRQHLEQRMAVNIVARAPVEDIQILVRERGWHDVSWLSATANTYPVDYHSEMPDGAQVPMVNVFTRRDGEVRHFWASELFFVPDGGHPRHVDMLWPLWHFFDLAPTGRGDFMPALGYGD